MAQGDDAQHAVLVAYAKQAAQEENKAAVAQPQQESASANEVADSLGK